MGAQAQGVDARHGESGLGICLRRTSDSSRGRRRPWSRRSCPTGPSPHYGGALRAGLGHRRTVDRADDNRIWGAAFLAVVDDQFDTVITGRIKSKLGLDRAGIGQRGGAGRWMFDPPPPKNQRVAVGIARSATIQANPPADMGDAILAGMSNWRGVANRATAVRTADRTVKQGNNLGLKTALKKPPSQFQQTTQPISGLVHAGRRHRRLGGLGQQIPQRFHQLAAC